MGRDVDRVLQMGKWVLAGLLAWFAALPDLVQALALMQLLDVAGGLLVAGRGAKGAERISSRRFGEGWRRKAYMWLIIMSVYVMESRLSGGYFPAIIGTLTPSDVVVVGFILMEAISLVENGVRLGLPVPSWLLTALAEGRRRFTAENIDENDGETS